ncbi:hypothetical protein ELR57_09895 [Cohnella sp. AR92]|nr:saccharopine dehydrogenase NADP-binding domain-containing protein [Cohnella sp. AR92]RUS47422.1 hypothetical protein ELR57_09895 [Cohnella sp. AR92]
MGKKLVVLGCGNVGSDVARYLAAEGAAEEILVADYNLDAAEALAKEIGAKAVKFNATDPESVRETISGADVVFNGVGPFHRFALPIIEQAIAAGVHYVDINDDFDVAMALVSTDKYDQAAKEAGVTVLFGAGSTPGLTNILARWGADQLDKAEAVHVSWGCSFAPAMSSAVIDHLFHCLTGDVPQFIDGKHVDIPAWSGERIIELQPPFGTYTYSFSGHAESVTLPKYLPGLRHATTRSTFFQEEGNELYKKLIALGLADTEVIPKLGISPRTFLAHYMSTPAAAEALAVDYGTDTLGAVFRVDVEGELNGCRTQIIYEIHIVDFGKDPTSTCAANAVLDILSGKVTQAGVYAPEAIIDPEPFVTKVMSKLGANLHRKMVQLDTIKA